jgi:hypothetical protein
MHAPHKERASRHLRRTGCSHRHADPAPAFTPLTPHTCADGPVNRPVAQSFQKPVQRRVIGDAYQSQHPAQLPMSLQWDLRFTKGPVFLAHQAESGGKLRLRESVFAETAAMGGKNRAGDFQCHQRKRQQSDLRHLLSYPNRKHPPCLVVDSLSQAPCRGCQQSEMAAWGRSPPLFLLHR